jgi:hypothetical protein
MLDEDKAAFKRMIDSVMALYGKASPDSDTMKIWWSKLKHIEFNKLTRAFNMYVEKYKIMPNPSTILDLCKNFSNQSTPFMIAKPKATRSEDSAERFKQMLKDFALMPKPEPKAWAKKILDNKEKYPDISIQYAKEALHVID